MPQKRKDCQITLQNPSYTKLYKILIRYEEPYLRDIFLQQVAYNCAIRLFALDFMDETDGLMIKLSNLAEYGLDTYYHSVSVLDYDTSEALYDIDRLILDFPFFDGIKEKIVNSVAAENKKSSKHQTYTSIHTTYEEYHRYPIVQKIMTPAEKEKLIELLQTEDHGEAFVLPIHQHLREQELPNCLKDDDGNTIKLDALQITQAFYYFDTCYFYGDTKSMISRSLTYPDEKKNQFGHDFRKLSMYISIMEEYILKKRYFELF